jgi:hypothetical protein
VCFGENHDDFAAGVVPQLVGTVLDELVDLAVAVAAFLDTALAVHVLLDQAEVDFVGLKHARGLLEDDFENGGVFAAHSNGLPTMECQLTGGGART